MGLKGLIRSSRRLFGRMTFDASDVDGAENWLWSKGYARHCDVRGSDSYWRAPTEMVQDAGFFRDHYAGAHGLVWVRLGTRSRRGEAVDIDRFVESALPSIDRPFVLVTSDGDATVPSDLRPTTVDTLLKSPFLRAWRTQNHDGSGGPKLRPLPIGLDLHTPRPLTSPRALARDLAAIAASRTPLADLPLSVFDDTGLNVNSADRRDAQRALADCPHVVRPWRRLSQRAIWRRYAGSPFVLSLVGNGLDCHRTWEALYLGAIVIAKRSPLDPLYDGLPVALIDDVAEIRDKANLQRWRDRLAPLADPARIRGMLDASAWMARIRAEVFPPD